MTKFARYALVFVLARAALFVVPLLLANLLSTSAYGTIEFAQAMAAVLALVLGLGANNVVPLILVRHVDDLSWSSLLALLMVMAATCGTLAAVLIAVAGQGTTAFVVLATAVLILQGFWSVTFKSRSRNEASLLADTGFWFSCVVGAAVGYLVASSSDHSTGTGYSFLAVAVYGTVLWLLVARLYREASEPATVAGTKATIQAGLPLMLLGLLSVVIASSGRIVLGLLDHAATVGIYAVIFRVTSAPIVAHQIASVALFRRFFELPEGELRRLSVLPSLVTALAAMAMLIVLPHLGWLFGPAFVTAAAQNPGVAGLLLAQSVIWSGISINDTLVNRVQVAGSVVRSATVYVLLMVPVVLLLAKAWPDFTLLQFAFVQATFMVGYYLLQATVLYRAGMRMTAFWATTLLSFGLLVALANLI